MAHIYVNSEKKTRAEELLALVRGGKISKTEAESDDKAKFGAFLSEGKIDPKSDDALPFIYEKLGGLLRTPAQQAEADKKKEEAQKKGKRKMIE